MEVKVLFHGFLRELIGQGEVIVSLSEGTTLQNLIDQLGQEFGDDLKRSLQPDSQSQFPLIIAIGGSDYRFVGGLESRLADKTSVYFIPPTVGG